MKRESGYYLVSFDKGEPEIMMYENEQWWRLIGNLVYYPSKIRIIKKIEIPEKYKR